MLKIGVDIGGMSAKIGLVNDDQQIIARKVVKTSSEVPADKMIGMIADGVAELLQEYELKVKDIAGIGVGCPGTINPKNGDIIYSNNLCWENVKLIDIMRSRVNTKVEVANDADVAALGEVCAGAARGHNNAVLLTLGTGVGGGVILNRKIFSGNMIGGCELGHTVIEQGGVLCTCGRRGCFEAYSSSTGLMRMAANAADANHDSLLYKMCDGDLSKMSGKIPFDAAAQGDQDAQEVIECYIDYLACGIANVINIFRPEVLMLGGGISAEREVLTVPLQEKVDKLCYGGTRNEIARIVVSELGNDAGIIGAANLV